MGIQWTEELSVGNPSLDTDHKLLLDLVNRLDEAIESGRGREEVGTVLNSLLDYTAYHFAREEALMSASGYPDVATHAHTHQVLRLQVSHIRDRFVANPDSIHDREVLSFLKNWLTSHILGRDKHYAPFLAAKSDAVAAAERRFDEHTTANV